MNLISWWLVLTVAVAHPVAWAVASQECTHLDGLYATMEQHSFRRINNWLAERLQFKRIHSLEQVMQLFEVLVELVEHTNRQLLIHLSDHDRQRYKEAETMLVCLDKMAQLAQLNTTNICHNSSYQILLTIDAATGFRSHLQEDDEYFSLGPIERVLLYLCRLRASQCQQQYPELYRRRASELGGPPLPDIIERIMKLRAGNSSCTEVDVAEMVALTKLERSPAELKLLLEDIAAKARTNEQRVTLEAMKHEPRDEVHRAAIVSDLRRMLSDQPNCNYYVQQMGDSLFNQARYDLLFLDTYKASQQHADYYQAWLTYTVCESLLTRADYIAIELVELAKQSQ